jgi:hypothetical protein
MKDASKKLCKALGFEWNKEKRAFNKRLGEMIVDKEGIHSKLLIQTPSNRVFMARNKELFPLLECVNIVVLETMPTLAELDEQYPEFDTPEKKMYRAYELKELDVREDHMELATGTIRKVQPMSHILYLSEPTKEAFFAREYEPSALSNALYPFVTLKKRVRPRVNLCLDAGKTELENIGIELRALYNGLDVNSQTSKKPKKAKKPSKSAVVATDDDDVPKRSKKTKKSRKTKKPTKKNLLIEDLSVEEMTLEEPTSQKRKREEKDAKISLMDAFDHVMTVDANMDELTSTNYETICERELPEPLVYEYTPRPDVVVMHDLLISRFYSVQSLQSIPTSPELPVFM